MTILYVDDDAEDRELFYEAVRAVSQGITCVTAKDGQEAIRLLYDMMKSEISLPDFIFLDVNMPVMDGKKCLAELKAHKNFRAIPVIIYSTSNRQADKIEFKKLGALDYIVKHNGYHQLVQALSLIIYGDSLN